MQSKPVSPRRRIRTNRQGGLERKLHALTLKGTDTKVSLPALHQGLQRFQSIHDGNTDVSG